MTSPDRLAERSVAIEIPTGRAAATPAVLLGHGAGSDYRETLLAEVSRRLVERGHLTCRFNFPYRDADKRMPDRAPVLEAAIADVAAALRAWATPPIDTLVAGGKSMGGRMASMAVAHGQLACRGLLFLGYPLHPPGKVDRLRTAHLAAIEVPMLFVSGTRDRLARLDLLEEAVAALGDRARLHLVPDGDHSLKVLKRTGRPQPDVYDDIADAVTNWIASIC